jgi:hypothetical protein
VWEDGSYSHAAAGTLALHEVHEKMQHNAVVDAMVLCAPSQSRPITFKKSSKEGEVQDVCLACRKNGRNLNFQVVGFGPLAKRMTDSFWGVEDRVVRISGLSPGLTADEVKVEEEFTVAFCANPSRELQDAGPVNTPLSELSALAQIANARANVIATIASSGVRRGSAFVCTITDEDGLCLDLKIWDTDRRQCELNVDEMVSGTRIQIVRGKLSREYHNICSSHGWRCWSLGHGYVPSRLRRLQL